MPVEIERKFLVHPDKLPQDLKGKRYVQGYLSHEKNCVVRVRIVEDAAYLTIKGAQTGISKPEFEYSIAVEDARGLLELSPNPPIEKVRYLFPQQDHVWEIDVFEGANQGLIVAEIELNSEDEQFEETDWLAEEVSNDGRYSNAALSLKPFTSW